MNSTIKTAAKFTAELSQSNEKSDPKQDGIKHAMARLGEFLKKKWKTKVMHDQYIRNRQTAVPILSQIESVHALLPLLGDPFQYYTPIYAWVFQVVSFPPKPCTNHALHALSSLLFFI
jgi:hypothetical protein